MVDPKLSAPSLYLPNFLLLAILGGLLAIYLGVLIRYDEIAHLGMSVLFFLGAGSLFWDARKTFPIGSNRRDALVGALLAGTVCIIGFYLLQAHANYAEQIAAYIEVPRRILLLQRTMPILSGLSIALLAFGWTGLRRLWRELAILVALGLPSMLAAYTVDISPLTARFSTAVLWYTGHNVVRDGLVILLEGGGVEVYHGCSGLESMAYLLGLSGLCLIMFPLNGAKRVVIPIVGLLMGFVINGIRVALMALLVAAENTEGFDYWHTGDGSLLFGMIAVICFGAFYMGAQTLEQILAKAAATTDVIVPDALPPSVLSFLEQEQSDRG